MYFCFNTSNHLVIGLLRGYDSLLNLLLDNTIEFLKDPTDLNQDILSPNGKRMVRSLGRSICRGTTIAFVTPLSGERTVENPFIY